MKKTNDDLIWKEWLEYQRARASDPSLPYRRRPSRGPSCNAVIVAGRISLATLIAIAACIYGCTAKGNGFQAPSIGKPGQHAERMRDNPQFRAYQYRRADRRAYARRLKSEMAAQKPPARGWTAIAVPYNPIGGPSAIQNGWVQQPPIPRPWWRSAPSCRPSRVYVSPPRYTYVHP